MTKDTKLKIIYDIPVDKIDDFPNHPYQVRFDEDMFSLVESISENGVLTPAIVRKKDDGRYEMISGHRRLSACKLLGIETIRCDIATLDREEAILVMCDSNIQRTTILPSEKAFSYKMRLEAMKKQGMRNDLTSRPLGSYLSVKELSKAVDESERQIHRYIRLTELIPEILELVDDGEIAMRPAVEISYFPENLQRELLYQIEKEACTPSHDQTLRMRRLLNDGKLTPEVIEAIMQEEKPNQKEKVPFKSLKISSLIPKNLSYKQQEEYVAKALEFYGRHLARKRDYER